MWQQQQQNSGSIVLFVLHNVAILPALSTSDVMMSYSPLCCLGVFAIRTSDSTLLGGACLVHSYFFSQITMFLFAIMNSTHAVQRSAAIPCRVPFDSNVSPATNQPGKANSRMILRSPPQSSATLQQLDGNVFGWCYANNCSTYCNCRVGWTLQFCLLHYFAAL